MTHRHVEARTIAQRDNNDFPTEYDVRSGFRPDPGHLGDPGVARFAFVFGTILVALIFLFCAVYGLVVKS